MRVLEIFLDGFGLGENNPEVNPIIAANTPYLDSLIGGHKLWGRETIRTSQALLLPLNAGLGVPGIPQSATGQTTLWTGINAAKLAGRHINAYPPRLLKEVIAEHSILKVLSQAGRRVTFANAFSPIYFELVGKGKVKNSTSTLVTLAADSPLRNLEDLRRGRAVYQDITNEFLRQTGAEVPLVSYFEAGKNLAIIAMEHDFTLFEFFQSDKTGHKQDLARGIELVEGLDSFIQGVIGNLQLEETVVLITSDHGNLEDITIHSHTVNPVPALLVGNYEQTPYTGLKGIEDVASFVIETVQKG